MQETSIKQLCNNPVKIVEEVCDSPNVLPKAKEVEQKLSDALTIFARCHATYNKGGPVSDDEIQVLGIKLHI